LTENDPKKAGPPNYKQLIEAAGLPPLNVARTRVHSSLTDVQRFPVGDRQVGWGTALPGYDPPFVDRPKLKPGREVDPADPTEVDRVHESPETSAEGVEGRPPWSTPWRTGMRGRGVLPRWGVNYAADPVVTRHNPDNGRLEMLLIARGDADSAAREQGQWALPGGWRDKGTDGLLEPAHIAAAREAVEETGLRGVTLDFSGTEPAFEGVVDDPRLTDDACIVTTAFLRHLSPEEARLVEVGKGPQLGDRRTGEAPEIDNVAWVPVTKALLDKGMYASHGLVAREAVKGLPSQVAVPDAGERPPHLIRSAAVTSAARRIGRGRG
jgi:ADP-ribose diphosphatase